MKRLNEKTVLLVLTLLILGAAQANAEVFSQSVTTFYTGTLRPILVSIVFIVFIGVGLFNFSDFQKGGEAAKAAFFHCLKMAMYPAFVLAIAEGMKALMPAT